MGAADTRREADDLLTLLWAGAAAEMYGEIADLSGWTGHVSDVIALIQLSAAGVAKHCLYSDTIKDKLKMRLYNQFGGGARELVREHWPAIQEVAAMLAQRGEMTGAQVKEVFERHHLAVDDQVVASQCTR